MLNPLTLRDELLALAPTNSEASAIDTLSNAYATYALGAEAGGVTITPAGVDLGKAALKPALVGMSASGAGLSIIPAALLAFWVAVAAGLATSFVGATLITPPPHAGLAAAFAALMPLNTAGNISKADAVLSVANMFHAAAIVGGTVTFPGPIVAPIL